MERGIPMMYMHYCKRCQRVHMLNGHKLTCPRCGTPLTELQISYMDYILMSREERRIFDSRLSDDAQLEKLSTTYRLYKYSKWYKNLKSQNSERVYSFDDESNINGVAFTLM